MSARASSSRFPLFAFRLLMRAWRAWAALGRRRHWRVGVAVGPLMPNVAASGSAQGSPQSPLRRVLVVEDDRDMAFAIRRNLEADGYCVELASDGASAISRAELSRPHVIVLDVMIPPPDGWTVLLTLRDRGADVPILLLTARGQLADKVRGFDLGADDYLTKPFSVRELMSRIAALIARQERALRVAVNGVRTTGPTRFSIGEVVVDVTRRSVTGPRGPIPLTPKAFDLLIALARREEGLATRRELMREVWGYAEDVETRTLDVHVAELRRRLESVPAEPRYVLTVWKTGYRLVGVRSSG